MLNNQTRSLAVLVMAGSLSLTLVGCPGASTGSNSNTTPAATGLPASNVQNGVDLMQLTAKKTITVGKGPHGMAYAGGFVFNANPSSGSISVIDAEAETVVATLADMNTPTGLSSPSYTKASHDGNYAISEDTKGKMLRVIKGSTYTQVGTVNLPNTPGSKFIWGDDHIAYVPVSNGSEAVAGTATNSNVVKVSWANGFETAAATSSMTLCRPGASLYTGGFLAAGGGYLAAPNGPDHSVAYVQLDSNGDASGSVKILQYGNTPGPIDISTYGGIPTLIYGNKTSNTVVLYNMAKSGDAGLLAVLNVGSTPTDMALRSDGRYAYVTCKGSGEVAVIDIPNKSLVSLLKIGRNQGDKTPNPVHIYRVAAPAGGNEQIWVSGDGDESVTVIDTQLNKVISVIHVGAGHKKMAFSATKAFASNITDNTVSVIDRTVIK